MTDGQYDTVQMDMLRQNRLLASLPECELALLGSRGSLVELDRRDVLYEAGKPIEAVFFIVDGIASLLSVMADASTVEIATVGREGMIGLSVFHGVSIGADQAMMQVAGQAYRVDAVVFRELLPSLPGLQALLHRFAVVMFTFAAQNSACNRKHSIEARCCRWMLTVGDRLKRTTFELTHDFIAQMLGVRRASVTETLGSLEKRGLISTSRGRLAIVDAAGLEACTCECYAIIHDTTERLLVADTTA